MEHQHSARMVNPLLYSLEKQSLLPITPDVRSKVAVEMLPVKVESLLLLNQMCGLVNPRTAPQSGRYITRALVKNPVAGSKTRYQPQPLSL